jgi:hypothetical protein
MRENPMRILDSVRRCPTLAKRFWAGVLPGDEPNACWEWRGPGGNNKRSLSVGRYSLSAARVSWFMTTGELPLGGRFVFVCGNPDCVRPSHLAWGMSARTAKRLSEQSNGVAPVGGPRVPAETRPRDPRLQLVIPEEQCRLAG